ncbi:helix-turn-helix transcriptional regulator [Phenylobacterium sp.]|uniref:helix-turn-helix domain-containing protein n=1 Tax=Phenylobacterium sp. TaxID=1871053 RepID=UPI0012034533|nr:helix-turn-helix transcriptional regulator [Phenylobacterium sp.]THD60941.1 MAG: LuxR family transcriptional regulator [Phenylobacterium sp.]
MREYLSDNVNTPRTACEATDLRLSPRQIECLSWVQEGKSSRDIGVILGVSHRIVERHVFRACQRLGVKTRLQAVIRARALGLIGDPESWSRPPRQG